MDAHVFLPNLLVGRSLVRRQEALPQVLSFLFSGKSVANGSEAACALEAGPTRTGILWPEARSLLLDLVESMKFNGMRCSSSDAVCVQLTFHSLWTVSAEGTTSIGYILRVRAHENEYEVGYLMCAFDPVHTSRDHLAILVVLICDTKSQPRTVSGAPSLPSGRAFQVEFREGP